MHIRYSLDQALLLVAVVMCLGLLTTKSLRADELADKFEKRKFQPREGATLLYRFLKPAKIEAGKSYPLVLFLHGAGERGDNNEAQLIHGVKTFAT